MTWKYCVIRKTHRVGKKTKHYYQIHERYDEKGKKLLWTDEPITPCGDTFKDLQESLLLMLRDSMRNPVYEIRKGKLVKRTNPKESNNGTYSDTY